MSDLRRVLFAPARDRTTRRIVSFRALGQGVEFRAKPRLLSGEYGDLVLHGDKQVVVAPGDPMSSAIEPRVLAS